MNPTKVIIVTRTEVLEIPIESLVKTAEVRGWKVVGHKRSRSIQLREEVENQPIFDKLCGPFFEGPGIVRYECPCTFDSLSR